MLCRTKALRGTGKSVAPFGRITFTSPSCLANHKCKYGETMTDYEFISLTITAIGSVLVFLGLVYTGRQLSLSRKVAIEDHKWRRRIEAQNAVAFSGGLAEMRQKLDAKLNYIDASEPLSLDLITKAFEEDSTLRTICHDLLNYYEMLARGIHQGIYDEKIIADARDAPMISTFEAFKQYIKMQQRKVPETWG